MTILRTLGSRITRSSGIDGTSVTTSVSVSSDSADDFPPDLLGAMSPLTETSVSTPLASALLNETALSGVELDSGIIVSLVREAATPVIETAVINARREEEETTTLGPRVSVGPDRGGPSSPTTETRTESDAAASDVDDEDRELGEVLEEPAQGETTSLFITSEDSEPGVGGVGEISEGAPLLPQEKPKMLLILSTRLNANRIPSENILFFKRLNSSRYRDVVYTILRKDIFIESNFRIIGTIRSDKFKIDTLYIEIARKILPGGDLKDIVSFNDINLTANRSYAYKLKVDFDVLAPGDLSRPRTETVVITSPTGETREVELTTQASAPVPTLTR